MAKNRVVITGIGVVSSNGTTFGSIKSISGFDKDAVTEGVRYVNTAFFSNTVINSPASQVSIKFNIKGFNATVVTGFCASIDAINYAVDFLKLGRAKAVFPTINYQDRDLRRGLSR